MNHKGARKCDSLIILERRKNQKYLASSTNDYHTLPDMKTYKAVVIEKMWYQHSVTNRPMQQNPLF